MENSAYVPSSGHLNSPALVVFSQAAGGLQDALRIQRPFNPQFAMSEASKELHRPFSASSFGLRHMEAYSGIPAHILNHLQPQFLHPGLSLGSGAFRPLADLKSFPSPSAFAPPKCLKIETSSESVHAGHTHSIFSPSEDRILGPSPRTDSCSPASVSLSPQPQPAVKEESMDAHNSEDGEQQSQSATDTDSPGVHDDNRGFRIDPLFGGGFASTGPYAFSMSGVPTVQQMKANFLFDHVICQGDAFGHPRSKETPISTPSPISGGRNFDYLYNKKKRDPSSCPICGLAIAQGDLETHLMHEVQRLFTLSGKNTPATRKRKTEPGRPPALPGDSGPEGRWETFQRIKTNRQSRLRMKHRKRKSDDGFDDPRILQSHSHCLRGPTSNDEDETVDVEGDSELEEWPERLRRRTSSPIGEMSGTIASSTGQSTEVDNESEDVIVDIGESEQSSFESSNSDVMKDSNKKDRDGVQSQVATVNSSGDVEVKMETSSGPQCDSHVSTSDSEITSRDLLIEELRNEIRKLEAEAAATAAEIANTSIETTDDYKCLICLEHYKNPAVSTVCWHVHCDDCWLKTLGSKKVCPQCNMVTTQNDLRRIFM